SWRALGLAAGGLLSIARRSDDAHRVFGTHRICCLQSSGWIVAPNLVRQEPVFVTAWFERYAQMPHIVGAFVHRPCLGVPVVKVAGQEHLPGGGRLKGERGHAVSVGELGILG